MGPAYGRVRLTGMTTPEAEDAIEKHLKDLLREPVVSVGLAGWKKSYGQSPEQAQLDGLEERVSELKESVEQLSDRVERQMQEINRAVEQFGSSSANHDGAAGTASSD